MEVSDIEGMKNRESRHILDEGQVEANFFNPQSLES